MRIWTLLFACAPSEPLVSHPVGTEPALCEPTGDEVGLDGIDNDCDGLVDCADDDLLQPFPEPITASNLEEVCAASCPREAPEGILIDESDLVDLAPLSCVTSAQRVEITDNPSLESLHGLEGLEVVDELEIEENPALTDLSGLDGLHEAGSIELGHLPELVSLHGLEQLTATGDLSMMGLPSLPSLEGLGSLERIDGSLFVDRYSLGPYGAGEVHNDSLTDLRGMPKLRHIGFLGAYDGLTSLAGLEELETLGGLYGTPEVQDLSALSGAAIEGDVVVHAADLSGLEGLVHGGAVELNGPSSLEPLAQLETVTSLVVRDPGASVTGLPSLREADDLQWRDASATVLELPALTDVGSLTVSGGAIDDISLPALRHAESFALANLDGIETFTALPIPIGELALSRMDALTSADLTASDLGGLTIDAQNLTDVALPPTTELSVLTLKYTRLTSLDAFASVRRVDGPLTLQYNDQLTDVTALHDLEFADTVTVEYNEALTNVSALELVQAIDDIAGSWTIRANW